MLDIFGPVREYLRLEPVRIESRVFRLLSKGTVGILLALSLLVTCHQYIGDPIDCIVSTIPPKVVDTYCWIHSTFTIPSKFQNVGTEIPHPGVSTYSKEDEVIYHKYYQWVCFFLFFQAMLFYAPSYFWNIAEGGLMAKLCDSLRIVVIDKELKEERKALVVTYLKNNLRHHNSYFYRYVFYEILGAVNVVLQLFFMNFFLGGEFLTYGTEVVKMSEMDPSERMDPLSRVFPKVTKCDFKKYGPSGTIQLFDALCVLPLNIVNEKIMIFIWFWYVTLAVLCLVALFVRLVQLVSPSVRNRWMSYKCVTKRRNDWNIVASHCLVGDWFVLNLMGSNIDSGIFSEIISDLAEELMGSKSDTQAPLISLKA